MSIDRTFVDGETGAAVSKRALGQLREQRAAQRQAQAVTEAARDEWRAPGMRQRREPCSEPAQQRAPQPAAQPSPESQREPRDADEANEMQRRGLIYRDSHPGIELGPSFRYSLTKGEGFVSDQSIPVQHAATPIPIRRN